MVDSALWHLPPFKEGRTEAGFRDALILETVLHFHKRLIHSDIALLTKDNRQREAALRMFKAANNFGVFGSPEEYAGFLDLARARFAPEFLHVVTGQADFVLHSAGFWREIEDRLRERFSLYPGRFASEKATIGPLPFNTSLLPVGFLPECKGEPDFCISTTRLVSVVAENEFHWATNMVVSAPYGAKAQGLLGAAALGNKNADSFRAIVISLEWAATVTEAGEFSDPHVLREQVTLDTFLATESELQSLRESLDLV